MKYKKRGQDSKEAAAAEGADIEFGIFLSFLVEEETGVCVRPENKTRASMTEGSSWLRLLSSRAPPLPPESGPPLGAENSTATRISVMAGSKEDE